MQHAFRTAADLGITPQEHEALIWVMKALESGEIPPEQFDMRLPWCGTMGCIGGWAAHHMNVEPFKFCGSHNRRGNYLELLFYPSKREPYRASVHQAALAIRNFLVDGAPRWPEVMAGG